MLTLSVLRALLRLRLLQPELHVHLAVHRRRGGEVLLSLLALARAPVEFAEVEVAVGDEGAHPEFGGKGHRLAVVPLPVFRICRLAIRRDGASHAERPCSATAFLLNARKLDSPLSELPRVIDLPREHMGFAQI